MIILQDKTRVGFDFYTAGDSVGQRQRSSRDCHGQSGRHSFNQAARSHSLLGLMGSIAEILLQYSESSGLCRRNFFSAILCMQKRASTPEGVLCRACAPNLAPYLHEEHRTHRISLKLRSPRVTTRGETFRYTFLRMNMDICHRRFRRSAPQATHLSSTTIPVSKAKETDDQAGKRWWQLATSREKLFF